MDDTPPSSMILRAPTAYAVEVVEDDPGTREQLREMLERLGLEVRARHSTVELLREYRAHEVGCVVLDLRLPGISGLELLERYVPDPIRAPVLVLTGYADVPTVVRAMRAGAIDLHTKPIDELSVIDGINGALRKHADNESARIERARVEGILARLTPREREVLDCLLESSLSREVAEDLGVSIRTVEAHRARITAKTGASLVQLALHLGRHGLA